MWHLHSCTGKVECKIQLGTRSAGNRLACPPFSKPPNPSSFPILSLFICMEAVRCMAAIREDACKLASPFKPTRPSFLLLRQKELQCCLASLHTPVKANLGTMKRLRGRGGFTVLLPYNTCAGLILPKKEAAEL